MLLRHLAQLQRSNALSTYSFDTFAAYWKSEIDAGYGSCNFQTVPPNAPCPPGTKPGYINGGSRRTLQALQQQPAAIGAHRKHLAANVNCLVAATHFAPLFFVYSSEADLVQAAVDTVFISHNNPDPIAAAEFLARALWRIIYLNMPLQQALEQAAAQSSHEPIRAWLHSAIAKVAESLDPSSALSRQDLVDEDNYAALHMAGKRGHSNIAALLCAAPGGAGELLSMYTNGDVLPCGNGPAFLRGDSALDLAKKGGTEMCAAVLRACGALE
jgi:hypothetical protein